MKTWTDQLNQLARDMLFHRGHVSAPTILTGERPVHDAGRSHRFRVRFRGNSRVMSGSEQSRG